MPLNILPLDHDSALASGAIRAQFENKEHPSTPNRTLDKKIKIPHLNVYKEVYDENKYST